jgi:hypothetical protein
MQRRAEAAEAAEAAPEPPVPVVVNGHKKVVKRKTRAANP